MKSSSAASATGSKCEPSTDLISLTGTQSFALRSSLMSSQCIWTHECQSKLP
jgi:hypothetical protein